MKINAVTAKGGAVEINKSHGVWASYAVGSVGTQPPAEILYAGVKLKSGKTIQFFVNRETGLVVLDLINKSETGGVELLRKTLE